ncbi:MAG: hypothetical protein IPK50_03975 [Fibrobacterota bacterium]|nr:MAG: hypothetical protein IPK50_03975 [Fibrobacterota bacterium]
MPDWLPPLLELNEPGSAWDGQWELYKEVVYQAFQATLAKPIRSGALQWRGLRLGLKKYPVDQDKEATFWHMVSEGGIEAERTPDLARCARIRWPGAILAQGERREFLIWTKEVKNDLRIQIYFPEERYLLVLALRQGQDGKAYLLPWTAYPVAQEHSHRKLLAAYEAWKKQGSPLPGTP